ncbi:MAG: serine hydroxymethyltransferase [Thermococcus sp.]|uniref:serine hydroxymethyltransferase n=1 Tax=Thermococcus sp. TaxID=35749 RepID=UPI000BCD4954|nr:serine hydroxymethyltransferase [Thermococcus sp.]MCD6139500.1 serine hydroxymethyltransferase [Thermococcus sp.]MCD6143278.1 serine hydroxymethyltransferase [Thermococcus sp.]OYT33273.1 MAG: serine hydroxymethyltransferase [Archaeoglobales archaeon ex4484_92]RLF86486.1 MAG: serine hydroxymethyltransferase [Thermococci archaeon]
MSYQMYRDKVLEFVEGHEKWRSSTINLIASENVTSPSAIRAIASGFMHKYAEGWPKQRYYQGCKYVDEVELIGVDLFCKLFQSDFADLRPISGTNANQAAFFGLTEAGDKAIVLHTSHGGHISHMPFGAAGMRGLEVHTWPFDNDEFNIDVDKAAKMIRELEPKIVVFGGSLFPFPHPVKELAPVAKEVGAFVMYDAAHVLGLIGGGQFQDPLREGAEVVTSSTHKTFPGPQGGVILYKDLGEATAKLQWAIFPGVLSNHHLHHMAGKVVTAAEMLEFGKAYAEQIVKNAKALAEAMAEEGFKVIGEGKGYTKSHQVIVDVSELHEAGGGWAAPLLEEAGIILNKNLLPWDPLEKVNTPSGLRIGVQEMTRVGMMEDDIKEIARFMRRVLLDKEDPKKVEKDVFEFRKQFQKVYYSFDYGLPMKE